MNIVKSKLLEETNCKYLLVEDNGNRYCKFLSNKIGRPQIATKSFCNLKCKESGAYDGRELSAEQERDFVVGSLRRTNPLFMLDKAFLGKMLEKYVKKADIIVPEIYPEIKKALEFLNTAQGFKKFYITGSAITSNASRPLKDIDILLWFETMEDYILSGIKKNLPSEINGVKTDYFYGSGDFDSLCSLFFCHMCPEEKKIYSSKWFNLNLSSIPEGFTVVNSKYEEYDNALRDLYNEPEPLLKGLPCCGKV